MSRSGYGLQGELAAAAAMQGHDSWTAFIERFGSLVTTAKLLEALEKFDAISLVLLVATIVAFFVPVFILFPPIPVERCDALRQTHSRVGLPPKRSNLRDQFAVIHHSQPGQPKKVQSLYIYPIKSCKGIELSRSRVLNTGLEFDRLYAFAQLRYPAPASSSGSGGTDGMPFWELLTRRQLPLLANVCVDLWAPDAAKRSRQLGEVKEVFLVVRFPWRDHGLKGLIQWLAAKISRGFQAIPEKEFMLPIEFPSHEEIKSEGYSFADVKIWKEFTYALNVEKELPLELSQYLGVKHRLGLFRIDPSRLRKGSYSAQPKEVLGYQPALNFHDAHPLNLLSLSSMQDLDTLLLKDGTTKSFDACRFRANIIISGSKKYEEETWKAINFKHPSTKEECKFEVVCRTVRSKLPNMDPDAAVRHKVEPDRALRKICDFDEEGAPKTGCLGMAPYATPSNESMPYIEVGMSIDVLERGSHIL